MSPRPAPRMYPDDLPHWNGAREGILCLPYCPSCGRFFWPPGPVCPRCLSSIEWRAASGVGRISSWVRFHKSYFDGDVTPYVVVQVELEEGPRLTTGFSGAAPQIGLPVKVQFLTTGDFVLPEFAPASQVSIDQ
jgi:uncharacterized OB-fold protein